MPKRKVDREEFRKLWAEGVSGAALAKRYGVCEVTIYQLRKRMGLPARHVYGDPEPKAPKEPKPEKPKATKRDAQKTGYARINEIAELQHVTFAEATRRYHRECGR